MAQKKPKSSGLNLKPMTLNKNFGIEVGKGKDKVTVGAIPGGMGGKANMYRGAGKAASATAGVVRSAGKRFLDKSAPVVRGPLGKGGRKALKDDLSAVSEKARKLERERLSAPTSRELVDKKKAEIVEQYKGKLGEKTPATKAKKYKDNVMSGFDPYTSKRR